MFLKIPVYLPTNDEFLITDAKCSRWLQEPEKNFKLFTTKPVTKLLQEKFNLLSDNCNQFWTKRCYCIVRPTLLTTKIITKKISKLWQFLFTHFNNVTSYSLVDIWMFKCEFHYLYDNWKLQRNISKVTIVAMIDNKHWWTRRVYIDVHDVIRAM